MTHLPDEHLCCIAMTDFVVGKAIAKLIYYHLTDQHQSTSLGPGGAAIRPTFDICDRPDDYTSLPEHQKATYWKMQRDRTSENRQVSSQESLAFELFQSHRHPDE